DRAHLADADLHRARLPVLAAERDPHRLALVHGEEDAAVLAPFGGHLARVVVDATDREASEPGRERIRLSVVGDAKRAEEGDGEPVAEGERVVREEEAVHADGTNAPC